MALLNKALQPLQEDFIEKFQALEEWEQSLLLSSMQRIANMMDAERLTRPVLEVGSYHKLIINYDCFTVHTSFAHHSVNCCGLSFCRRR